MNKFITTVIIIAILVVGGILIFGNGGSDDGATGTVYFNITDAAANMENINAVDMEVSDVALHSQSEGWTSADVSATNFSLLELNANNETRLVAEADVAAETYDQVRLTIDSVQVEAEDETGATSTSQATLATNDITVTGNVSVEEQSTSTVTFDVMADQSLHVTDDDEYVFAPVVAVESRSNASISVSEEGTVTVSSGNVTTDVVVGTDADGTVKTNFKLDSSGGLQINNGTIEVLGATTSSDNSTNVETETESTNSVDVEL